MSNYLKKLSDISPPNLVLFSFDDIVSEVINTVKLDSNWNSLWDGELDQNASLMILEMFSYLFKKNAEYENRLIRENLIKFAKNPNSILSILYNSNVQILQNTGSNVILNCSINNDYLPTDLIFNPGFTITGKDLNGNSINFEIYQRDINDTSKIDYFSPIIIPMYESSFKLEAFAGNTFIHDVVLTSDYKKNFTVEIPYSNVIQDSIRIFYDINDVNKELIRTFTFSKNKNPVFLPDFPNGIPYFKELFDLNGKPTILFGNENFGGDFAFPANKILRIIGRTGGGSITNINARGINTSRVFSFANNKSVTVYFTNIESASGGSDRENIEELRAFGPLRSGRDSKITDDRDVLNVLRNISQKAIVNSPIDSITDNKVQVFHYENLIAPKRTFSDFIFPKPLLTDTIESYNTKFLSVLNEYLNLSGIRDRIIEKEFINLFISDTDIWYNIIQTPPLNGSIIINAYDEYGNILDRLNYSNNYINGINYPDLRKSHAVTGSYSEIITSITVNSSNNKLKFILDSAPFGSGNIEEITLDSALYGFDVNQNHTDLANEINNKIKQIPVYANYINHRFCYAENKKIYLISPNTGEESVIKIIDTVNSIHNNIKFPLTEVYAYPETGRVFKININDSTDSSYYIHGIENDLETVNKSICSTVKDSNIILVTESVNSVIITPGSLVYGNGVPVNTEVVSINGNLITVSNNINETRTEELISFKYRKFSIKNKINQNFQNKIKFTDTVGPWPDTLQITGPSKYVSFFDYNSKMDKFQTGSTVTVEAYEGITKIGEIQFQSILNSTVNTCITISGDVFDDLLCNFDYTSSSLYLKMTDADSITSPPYGYNPVQGINYTNNTYFKISYSVKNYVSISMDYRPNPYFLTGEAGSIQKNILNGPEKRMMCFIPVFKRIEFIPVKLLITVFKQKYKNSNELKNQLFTYIQNNFSYFSQLEDFTIGNGFNIEYIRNDIIKNSKIDGIEKIIFNRPNQSISDSEGNKYYFLLTENFINRIKGLESLYPNISGFSKLYDFEILSGN